MVVTRRLLACLVIAACGAPEAVVREGSAGVHGRRVTVADGGRDHGRPGPADDRHVALADRMPATIARADSGLVVRVLDVGQGDAIYITNGASKVLVDGGPDPGRLGALFDSLGLNKATIDVVVLSHQHYDHHGGLRELFRSDRRIRVRYFFENGDASAGAALAELRDSAGARVARGELVYRDTDDPCGDGRAICTITLRGGAKLHVMRPRPRARAANNRSVALKLVGPDSASFTMWLAGDAEHEALRWFDAPANYDAHPGMRVNVLKANHHGSCDGVTSRYLRLVNPDWVLVSLGAQNGYGHVHAQAKSAFERAGVPWYRTDRNGTITIRSPGSRGRAYSIHPSRGRRSEAGPSDRLSSQKECNPVP